MLNNNTEEELMTKTENISPDNVHSTLAKYMLADGFSIVLDMKNSNGSRIN